MTMAEIIKYLRLKNNMTQEELGKHLGIQKSAIRKYESGLVENIPRSSIVKMATLFGVKPSYIMGFEEDEEDNAPEKKQNVFISYKDLPNGRARRGAEYTLRLRSGLQDFSDVRERLAATKALVTGEQTKMADVRRNGITVINLCNSKTKKLCSKISKLDDSDIDKTVGYVEALLTAEKYQKKKKTEIQV